MVLKLRPVRYYYVYIQTNARKQDIELIQFQYMYYVRYFECVLYMVPIEWDRLDQQQ